MELPVRFRTAQGAEYSPASSRSALTARALPRGVLEAGIVRGRAGAAAATGPAGTGTAARTAAVVCRRAVRLDSAVLSAEGQQAVQGILAQVREAAQVQSIR